MAPLFLFFYSKKASSSTSHKKNYRILSLRQLTFFFPAHLFMLFIYIIESAGSASVAYPMLYYIIESAGSASVAYHMLSPLSYNLFNRAILQSASGTNFF